MIKAVFFDIDGTLVSFQQKISEATRKSLDALRKNNVKLFIATGRSPALFGHIKSILDFPFDGYALFNGQYCIVDGQTIHELWLSTSSLEAVYPYIKEHDIPCEMVEIDYRYAVSESRRLKRNLKKFSGKIPMPPVEDFHRIYENRVYQLSVFITQKEECEFFAHMPGAKAARWSSMFTDVIPETGGKAVGLQKILDQFGFAREECMAFGDGGNDIEMLRFAGIGVAMGNAGDDVKQAADYVTTSVDEDGVYNALLKHKIIDPIM